MIQSFQSLMICLPPSGAAKKLRVSNDIHNFGSPSQAETVWFFLIIIKILACFRITVYWPKLAQFLLFSQFWAKFWITTRNQIYRIYRPPKTKTVHIPVFAIWRKNRAPNMPAFCRMIFDRKSDIPYHKNRTLPGIRFLCQIAILLTKMNMQLLLHVCS